jgi:hypothetical protein
VHVFNGGLSRFWRAVLLALFLAPATAAAQEPAAPTSAPNPPRVAFVVGTLLDADSQQPLARAAIQLVTADTRAVRAQTVTNAAGEFRIVAPAAGSYRLRTWRVDADTVEFGPFDATSDRPLSLNLMARARPITLQGIEVSVAEREKMLTDQGFHERQRGGAGVYLTPKAIQDLHALQTPDVFRSVPGLRFVPQLDVSEPVLMTVAGVLYEQIHPPRGQRPGMSDPRTCLPVIFVDGAMVQAGGVAAPGEAAIDLRSLPAFQLLAVEVYRGPAEVPARFQAPMATCGVIVIWMIGEVDSVSRQIRSSS